MKTKVLLFLLALTTLQADVFDHLKPALDKGEGHSYGNIDFIYMINLDQRPEKIKNSLAQLAPYGINPYRFSAVNGWELSLETINDVGVKFAPGMEEGILGSIFSSGEVKPVDCLLEKCGQTYFCHKMPRGSIGIVLSQLSILKDAYDAGYETIWILEDDIVVASDPSLLPSLIDELDSLVGKGGWDMLFTDRDTRNKNGYVPAAGYAKRPNFTPKNPAKYHTKMNIGKFIKTGARFGAYSVIYRRQGIAKLLNFFKKYQVFLPYDMDYYLPDGIQLFSLKNDIVIPLVGAPSDNGKQGYK